MTTANSDQHHSTHGTQNKPRLIFWELTKGCNLRCIHCRASATELSSPQDLSTQAARDIIDQIAEVSSPILVLSGGEPLFRSDIFQLARYGTDKGLRVALATNGTLVTKQVAKKIVDSGVKRVAISLDGSDALTHDTFRGIPGAFDAAGPVSTISKIWECQCRSTRRSHATMPISFRRCLNLRSRSERMRCTHSCWCRWVAVWISLLEQMVPPDEYERMLNWFYDRSLEGGIELKATCAPHYFRVVRQRHAAGHPFCDGGRPGCTAESLKLHQIRQASVPQT